MFRSSACAVRCLPYFILQWTVWSQVVVTSDVLADKTAAAELMFLQEPEDLVVAAGSSATLHCRPQLESLVPLISWRFNGASLSRSPDREVMLNGSLWLHTVRVIDRGDYQCQVALPSGGYLLSKFASLQLAELEIDPEVTSTTLNLLLGQTARFSCGLRGEPAPSLLWLKNGQELQLDESRMLQLAGQLEIETVQLVDQAEYACRGSSAAGALTGPTHRLVVSVDIDEASRPVVPHFVAQPRDSIGRQGQLVTLHCAANGYPQPQVTWLKDGNTIDMSFLDRRFFLVGVSSLQIVNVQSSDSGLYQCRAVNAVDAVDASAQLSVTVEPQLVTLPVSQLAAEQQDVQLECSARGTPQPSVVWTKDGELLHQSKYFRISERRLRILGLVSRDSGVYQCFAANTAGKVQAAARLTVTPAAADNSSSAPASDPRPVSADGPTLAGSGAGPSAPFNVTARVVGARFVALTWKIAAARSHLVQGYSVMYRQVGSERQRVLNVSKSSETSLSLQVQDLLPDTQYEFRVTSVLTSGHTETAQPLLLSTAAEPAAPAAPQQLRATAAGSTQLLVSWSADVPPAHVYMLTLEPVSGGGQLLINTSATSYLVSRLHKYTQYRVRVSAVDARGRAAVSAPLLVRTWSDVPSDTPQNVTIETISDTSVEVYWLPPRADQRNGPLTGYKLRYRLVAPSSVGDSGGGGGGDASRRSQSVVTDASRRSCRLTALLRQAEYQIKVAALTVNGTGPFTRWLRAHTYRRQQAEVSVPGRPGSLRARPSATTITALWTPPADRSVRVRGYTLGWGRGVPDSQSVVLPDHQYHYVIRRLAPGSEYVLSLRALNAAGNGTPVYETLWTRPADHHEQQQEALNTEDSPDLAATSIPTGLKVDAVSETAMVLHWSDLSLPGQEYVDGRVYRVRYTVVGQTAYQYFNSSTTNCMIDDLTPDTSYEFTVQTIVGESVSGWSMLQTNRTREAAPGSAPRDITIVQSDQDPTVVSVNWQPPKLPNGKIKGYVVQYSSDPTVAADQWLVRPVSGGALTATLQHLQPATLYWVRVQAVTVAGAGPASPPVKLLTSLDAFTGGVGTSFSKSGSLGDNLLYVVVSCSATAAVLLGVLLSICLYKRKSSSSNISRNSGKNGYIKGHQTAVGGGGGCGSPDLKPPDLWIHHQDQMELGRLATGGATGGSCSSLSRRHSRCDPDLDPGLGPADARSYLSSTVDRRRQGAALLGGVSKCPSPPTSTVTDSCLSDDMSDVTPYRRHSAFRVPLSRLDSSPSPGGYRTLMSTCTLTSGGVETRPFYPHSQYLGTRAGCFIEPSPGACVGVPAESHYGAGLGMISASSSDAAGPAGGGYLSSSLMAPLAGPGYSSSVASSSDSSCLHQRLLEQHGVTATLAAAAAAAAGGRGMPAAVTAQASAASHTTLSGSPLRRPPLFTCAPLSTGDGMREELMPLKPSYSTEELSQEMANLEGLMKDLSVITASEFQC